MGLRQGVQEELASANSRIKELEREETLLTLVAKLFQGFIDQEVNIGVQAVESLQTEGLQTVFSDQDIRVRAEVEVQRGKVSVDLVTLQKRSDGVEVEGLSNEAFGGSVATVQSILLRILIIFRRELRPILLLDESLPAFDANYMGNMGRFLAALCTRLGLDILLVTQNAPALVEAADRVYRIVPKGGTVQFELIRGDARLGK